MNRRHCDKYLRLPIAALLTLLVAGEFAYATELEQLTKDNYDKLAPAGKETDAIYGDWVLRNDKVTVVIAQPIAGRNANMTVRNVSGMVIDFSTRVGASDQLSCFYATGGRYLFDKPESMQVTVDGQLVEGQNPKLSGKEISISFAGKPVADDKTESTVTYTLRDGQAFLDYQISLTNSSDKAQKLSAHDSLRCDGALFAFGNDEKRQLFYAHDAFFGQCYGFVLSNGSYQRSNLQRNLMLMVTPSPEQEVASGKSLEWSGKLLCSQGLPGIRNLVDSIAGGVSTVTFQLKLQTTDGVVQHADVELLQADESLGVIKTNNEGIVRASLLPGDYQAKITSIGRDVSEHKFTLKSDIAFAESITLKTPSRVRGTITDADNKPIAAKIQFSGLDGQPDPNFGPDAGTYAVKNLVYCAKGKFEQVIDPGKYEVIISHGPEYDVDTQQIEVQPGQLVLLKSSIKRSVDTQGWISSDFHSHSSPSGDNVSSQLGRVLNLLAEHIEFAPCTEHNRIDTYEDDLLSLQATSDMATCTGIELTGSPLPINHQNAFPLHRHVHEQDGGGPTTLADPVKQIERLALWDSSSSKVVQTNHPYIAQILGDADLDGKPDDGFRGMLGWMDVIEIHPPEGIFNFPEKSAAPKDQFKNPMFFWLQLLNLGYRIPGVVNTDAHYNFHGSGWLRNYMECSTDAPAEIKIDEMIHSAEHGHTVMTTGPFLQAQVRVASDGKTESYISGDDVKLTEGRKAKLWVRVQCPNWFDINRVQVFVNGRPFESLNFTRKSHPLLFNDSTVRFESEFDLPSFSEDAHIIVATIGEGLTLGKVMGPEQGKLPPVAVTNPIFLDVDGRGFQPNGDNLGIPFMLPELKK